MSNSSNCSLIASKLNESVSLNSFKSELFDSEHQNTTMNNNKNGLLAGQGELIEECKNSLNELIKASKWSNFTVNAVKKIKCPK